MFRRIGEKLLNGPHTLLDALLYFTDCQIASYEWAAARKSFPKNELKRQRHLVELMLKECTVNYASSDDVTALSARLAEADEVCAKTHGAAPLPTSTR